MIYKIHDELYPAEVNYAHYDGRTRNYHPSDFS